MLASIYENSLSDSDAELSGVTERNKSQPDGTVRRVFFLCDLNEATVKMNDKRR